MTWLYATRILVLVNIIVLYNQDGSITLVGAEPVALVKSL